MHSQSVFWSKAWKRCYVLAGWIDGQIGTDRWLTVPLSTFGKKEDQQLPDEPHPDDEREKEKLKKRRSCS